MRPLSRPGKQIGEQLGFSNRHTPAGGVVIFQCYKFTRAVERTWKKFEGWTNDFLGSGLLRYGIDITETAQPWDNINTSRARLSFQYV